MLPRFNMRTGRVPSRRKRGSSLKVLSRVAPGCPRGRTGGNDPAGRLAGTCPAVMIAGDLPGDLAGDLPGDLAGDFSR